MTKRRKIGMLLILIGLGLVFIPFPLSLGGHYESRLGIIGSLGRMEVVITEGSYEVYRMEWVIDDPKCVKRITAQPMRGELVGIYPSYFPQSWIEGERRIRLDRRVNGPCRDKECQRMRRCYKKAWVTRTVPYRIAISYPFLLSLGMLAMLAGVGVVAMPVTSKESKPGDEANRPPGDEGTHHMPRHR